MDTTPKDLTRTSSKDKDTPKKSKKCSFTDFFRACCYRLPMFHPYKKFRLIWDFIIFVALIYTSIEIPLSIAFELELTLKNTLGIIALSIDILLLIDIAINFRTQFFSKYDRLRLRTDPIFIAKRYFVTYFWLDLITSFPFEFIVNPQNVKREDVTSYIKMLRIFRFLRIIKLLRAFRVFRMLHQYFATIISGRGVAFSLKMVKVIAAMILTAHYFACVWWGVGAYHAKQDIPVYTNDDGVTVYSSWIQSQGIELDDPLFLRYSASWYWAIVTLFTTGYGDITAQNPTEQWVCSIAILAGSCFFAYFVGTITNWISEYDRERSDELDKVEQAQAFCRHYKLSYEMTRKILTHVRYHCDYNFTFEPDDILQVLPPFLQRKVNAIIAKRYLIELDLFKNIPKDVIGQIALSMQSISCNANTFLFKRGDIAKCLYLQRTGCAELQYPNGSILHELERGDIVGERALICGKRRFNVFCNIYSEFFVLKIDSIKAIFHQNFKPKRVKYELNKIKKMVKETTNIQTNGHIFHRRCNLSYSTYDDDEDKNREKVQQKHYQKVGSSSEYLSLPTSVTVDIDADKSEIYKSSQLDMDDLMVLSNDNFLNSEHTHNSSFVWKRRKSSQKSEHENDKILSKKSSIFSAFNTRTNSERRDVRIKEYEKAGYDDATFNFADSELIIAQESDDNGLDDSTDEDLNFENMLRPKFGTNSSNKLRHNSRSNRKMTKFGGGTKKRNMIKKHKKIDFKTKSIELTNLDEFIECDHSEEEQAKDEQCEKQNNVRTQSSSSSSHQSDQPIVYTTGTDDSATNIVYIQRH